jgi:hypothetical protein
MSIYHGTKPMEFERGKAGIAVSSKAKLPALIGALIGAVRSGELDELLAKPKLVGAPKARKAA